MREAHSMMASLIRGHGAVPCGSGDQGGGDRGVPSVQGSRIVVEEREREIVGMRPSRYSVCGCMVDEI